MTGARLFRGPAGSDRASSGARTSRVTVFIVPSRYVTLEVGDELLGRSEVDTMTTHPRRCQGLQRWSEPPRAELIGWHLVPGQRSSAFPRRGCPGTVQAGAGLVPAPGDAPRGVSTLGTETSPWWKRCRLSTPLRASASSKAHPGPTSFHRQTPSGHGIRFLDRGQGINGSRFR